jgi:ribosomal-protein-alanine N-acetyltransferase
LFHHPRKIRDETQGYSLSFVAASHLAKLALWDSFQFRPEYIEGRPVVSVRFAHKNDIDKVLEIEGLSFLHPWDYHIFELALGDIFLVFDEQGISGYLVAVCCSKNIRATIMKMAVHPEDRRKGVATALLHRVLKILKGKEIIDVCLNVDIIRKPAIALYEKFGFKIMQTIHLDYEDDLADDAFYIMKLMLAES